MRATDGILVASHADCALHRPTLGHPDRPERLVAAIAGSALPDARPLEVKVDPRLLRTAVERVHDPGLLARLDAACRTAPGIFDSPDNPVSTGTAAAARAAAAAVVAGAGALLAGQGRTVWAPVRPPGHHALRGRAMGFCFLNNAAIAAEELLAGGAGPVAVVDFDVHHGNGTQGHFWLRDDVYYLSVHRYPFFPGSGGADEVGEGRGRGFTRNLPLVEGAGNAVFLEALTAGLEDLVTAVTPRAWVISAGFDGHRDDPLGGMSLTGEGFEAVGRLISGARGGSPMLAVLEGGYNPEALQRSVHSFLSGLSNIAGS